MKLSDYIRHFEQIDKVQDESVKRVLTPEQAFIFRDILAKYNTDARFAILNSKSGSGKTTLIRALQKHCQASGINIKVTATTGKASSALGGQTIHSYLGLKMLTNDEATTKDEALKLTTDIDNLAEMPDILVIDEASMIGQKLFSIIQKARFNFVFFVLDIEQLPPVKEKKVEWDIVADLKYTLTKTLRAKDPAMTALFDDFKSYKEGNMSNFSLNDYINGNNIVLMDWEDVDYIPTNSECCSVAYRNKLVEYLVAKLTTPQHNRYNLNNGVIETRMVTKMDKDGQYKLNSNGYYVRDFEDAQIFFNGEDVQIDKLISQTKEIVSKGYCNYNGHRISMNKNKTGLTISAHSSSKIIPPAKEPIEYKCYLKFPPDDVIQHTTLACINNEHFVLLWDNTEEEFNNLQQEYFQQLLPSLKIMQAIKKFHKHHDKNDIRHLDYDIREALTQNGTIDFFKWWNNHIETSIRKRRWSDYLGVSSVCSARPTTSRTIHKAQGISIPAVVIFDDSFYGASLSAQYVGLTRAKHGVILVAGTPREWKDGIETEEEYV